MRNLTIVDLPKSAATESSSLLFSTISTSTTSTSTIRPHQSIVDDRPLLILIASFGAVGIVFVTSIIFFCCYFYRTRQRRRNYPLSLNLQNNNSTIVTNDGNSGDTTVNITRSIQRSRSPVTTEADIYGFDGGRNRREITNDVGVESSSSKSTIVSSRPSGFDNPMYKTKPIIVGDSSSLNRGGSMVINSTIRKGSSSASSVLVPPSTVRPAMLVVDETTEDHHRRLVPNDALSMEIDRSQRWIRDSRQALRNVYESEQRLAKDSMDDLSSINNNHDSTPTTTNVPDSIDGLASSTTKAQQQQAQTARKKLRRRLAETIANDRVLETTVTFTSDTLSSPATTPTPLLPPGGGTSSFSLGSFAVGGIDIRRKYAADMSDDDDLEVIFKERTPL